MPYYSDSEDEESNDSDNDGYSNTYKRKQNFNKPVRKIQKTHDHAVMRNAKTSHHTGKQQAGVYVLKNTTTNVFYVGKSENIPTRIQQHKHENRPAVLTREMTLTKGSVTDLESWERNEVLTRMYHNGMESVRPLSPLWTQQPLCQQMLCTHPCTLV
jgi:predicted GIY-YIG superfamily endonuclease